jgi:hypothetical protein
MFLVADRQPKNPPESARETMEQQQLRGMRRAGLAIEDVAAVHVGNSVLV